MQQYLAMGGYGPYVWSAFGVTAAIMAGLFWQSVRTARKQAVELEELRLQRRAHVPGRTRPLTVQRPADHAAPSQH